MSEQILEALEEKGLSPGDICEQTIRTEEQNLAHVHVLRSRIALAATMGDGRARKEAAVLERSEARIRRRLTLARLALAHSEAGADGEAGSSLA
jgi:hypothetical protein